MKISQICVIAWGLFLSSFILTLMFGLLTSCDANNSCGVSAHDSASVGTKPQKPDANKKNKISGVRCRIFYAYTPDVSFDYDAKEFCSDSNVFGFKYTSQKMRMTKLMLWKCIAYPR